MTIKHWAVLITVFYALVVSLLLCPLIVAVAGVGAEPDFLGRIIEFLYAVTSDEWRYNYWVSIAVLVAAQALLLFVTVDGSRARRKPRRHVFVTVAAATISVGVLTLAASLVLVVGVFGDAPLEAEALVLSTPLIFWALWGGVFYAYRHQLSARFDRLIGWLLKGSVLELLIALPAHIVTRQRNDCCAPGITLAGIATGFAVMLMAFGPAVILLYRRRIEQKQPTV